jgi:choline-sulfatase
MTEEGIRGMRRAYSADVTLIDDAIGGVIAALEEKGVLDDTWIIYTSDHGEMGGNHGLMSKCVLYREAVRVPLIMRPPGGCSPRSVDSIVEHVDVPATIREIAGAPAIPDGQGRSLLHNSGYSGRGEAPGTRSVSVSENWGFASFETDRYKIVVDEDLVSPCQLFDLRNDPNEDHDLLHDRDAKPTVDELMQTYVRPFLQIPPARPHPSIFTG